MSDKEFRQKMAEIYLRYAEKVLDTADGIQEKIKPMVEEMSDGHLVQREVLRESKGDCTRIQKYIISLPPITKKN